MCSGGSRASWRTEYPLALTRRQKKRVQHRPVVDLHLQRIWRHLEDARAANSRGKTRRGGTGGAVSVAAQGARVTRRLLLVRVQEHGCHSIQKRLSTSGNLSAIRYLGFQTQPTAATAVAHSLHVC